MSEVKPLIDAGFGVKGLKSWEAREGLGYTFTLTFGGKPVASIREDGNGGMLFVDWMNLRWDGTPMPGLSTSEAKKADLAREAKAKLDDIVQATPPSDLDGTPLPASADLLLAALADHAEHAKWLARRCKKETLFRLPEDKEGAYRTVKRPYSPAIKAFILGKYPTAEIANENLA